MNPAVITVLLYLCYCTCVLIPVLLYLFYVCERSKKVEKVSPFHKMFLVLDLGKEELSNQARLRIMY